MSVEGVKVNRGQRESLPHRTRSAKGQCREHTDKPAEDIRLKSNLIGREGCSLDRAASQK
uniref:Uncharacterized protein n=1 Tax=Heterorhabditis bacteriophora TaxID=37862 RepID=A0A1I7X425_HETBA